MGVPMKLQHIIEILLTIWKRPKRLFSLPLQQKLKAARSPDGIAGYGVARISSFFSKLMWSEGFTIFGSPLEHARQLWPHDYNLFCDVIQEYENEMEKLAGRLMCLMLGSLGITKDDDVKWANGPRGGCSALQLNSYPACPDPDRASGLAAYGFYHINHPSPKQHKWLMLREGNGWVMSSPLCGVGYQRRRPSTHTVKRVVLPVFYIGAVNRTRHRLSVAYLYVVVAVKKFHPLELVDQRNPPMYRPVTWSEYLGTKAKHFDKALSSVQLCAPRIGFVTSKDQSGVQVDNITSTSQLFLFPFFILFLNISTCVPWENFFCKYL
ncbi:gibberellin 3-beta-dioxygenase [Datura stramonium]|uniref:Gibberellin 3-beta-dioxygenase n=1 Tax=Datura stramonium TaxID=4076 RepID=A0ABS8WVW2_DATST|nr:gibberellin 3-beta-dioxygenase [Datura stramonium]